MRAIARITVIAFAVVNFLINAFIGLTLLAILSGAL